MAMKQKAMKSLMIATMALSLVLTPLCGFAQENNNTSKGQMKESGSEVKKAGQSMGRNTRHGRLAKGGKHFGKHMGRAGKHFGRGTKKAVKHVIS
jgi:Ni/Co efflux regulator RcnB